MNEPQPGILIRTAAEFEQLLDREGLDYVLTFDLVLPSRTYNALRAWELRPNIGAEARAKPPTLRELRALPDAWLARNVRNLGRMGVKALRAEIGYPDEPSRDRYYDRNDTT